ncbi:hypothetical protein GCM10023170_021200 [Phytohabitans houttuyneae]|uniref:Uncharacterized protein n=1 Tax=Phytohabitans houttuyneae TaxID=1076126 RepID=A0A6V8JUR2_9ACTN|nr:hypothetical protein Phou_005220 [Phytohabitans houttuyneae]
MLRKDDPEGYVRTTTVRLHISRWRRPRRERLVGEAPDRGRPERTGATAERTVVTWPDPRGGSYLLDLKAIRYGRREGGGGMHTAPPQAIPRMADPVGRPTPVGSAAPRSGRPRRRRT